MKSCSKQQKKTEPRAVFEQSLFSSSQIMLEISIFTGLCPGPYPGVLTHSKLQDVLSLNRETLYQQSHPER